MEREIFKLQQDSMTAWTICLLIIGGYEKPLQPTCLLDVVGWFLWWVVVATSGAIRALECPPEDHNFLSIPKVAFGRLVKEIQSEAQGLQNYHWVSLNHRKIIYISSRSSIYYYTYHPSAFEENLRPTVTGQVSRRTGFSGCWRGRRRALAIHWSGYFEKRHFPEAIRCQSSCGICSFFGSSTMWWHPSISQVVYVWSIWYMMYTHLFSCWTPRCLSFLWSHLKKWWNIHLPVYHAIDEVGPISPIWALFLGRNVRGETSQVKPAAIICIVQLWRFPFGRGVALVRKSSY